MPSTWAAIADLLDPAMLTVQAQAVSPLDTGEDLLWADFFPREDVDSVTLQNVTTVDYRPAADRREWNSRGRFVPTPTPSRRAVQIVPIEAYDKIEEFEMQRMAETATGNAQTIRDLMGVSIPKRNDKLAMACWRRLEVDAFAAWANGAIVQRSPENAAITVTASFGFDSSRYLTAATAWNDPSVNAYQLLLAWIAAGQDLVGPIKGAMMRLNVLNAILADAPNQQNNVVMSRSNLESRLSDDLGQAFQFYVNENSVDIFTDGGTAYTRTKIWPAGKIAAIPADNRIGVTAFAPIRRAMEISSAVGADAGIDVRGVTVFTFEANDGREMTIEAQLNAVPVPEEQRLYVTATGVA